MLKKIIFTLVILALLVVGLGYGAKGWVKSLLPEKAHFLALKESKMSDFPYLTDDIPAPRGKILAVVTSVDKMTEDKETGYEHTELARAYWVFIANGFTVDIASPKGGKPPVVIDGEDMGAYDYAFLNNETIQQQVANSIPLANINPDEYEAVYFVGGKGTMFDFPNNPHIQNIAKTLYQNNKVVSAVCHGPAALVNVRLDNGDMLLSNKNVSAFTNEEELFLIPDAKQIFPFLLQDKLIAQGAQFQAGTTYLEKVTQDGKLITGQNPWSVWTLAEKVIAELGYEPKTRQRTPEEYAVALLLTYDEHGFEAAKQALKQQPQAYQRILIVMHGVLAFMQLDISKGIDIFSLANQLKQLN
ncbi:type 1 glutamine amidotransferase domain-containing protein [Pseudoalteromonas sp. MMG005]|uniref:type 1 glutamine amidotransferase domain-containing protein n=1 Tax=Pseudoalteromonas sp. MMG005 TaxID=2822682 RepID=UPI001B3A2659|nr:type 1 glutamine amidotransferase domain-containing protein [Pseudoalteromonas sp. MMG005]MBQ4847447.1 type 1 glutamine amidotransferase domain-containing protein [Pseudoalteromonas sp. MMG005]